MASIPKFLQGVFPFTGEGLAKPVLIDPALAYVVPPGTTAQPLYFRGGNSAPELVVAAPSGVTGEVVVDFGIMEV